jgi:hypothetical protein
MPTSTLPNYVHILGAGFSQARQPAVLRTDMESGPPKQSKVLSRVLVTRNVRLMVKTKADYASFITWFTSDLTRGSEWFNWADPVDGATKLGRFVGGVLGGETPLRPQMDYWEITAQIETWDA